MRLENKVAVITGGSRGIGASIASLFAREGAAVTIGDVLVEDGEALAAQINQEGGKAIFCKVDVTSESEVNALYDAALDAFGRVDISINNAGIRGGKALTTDLPLDDWDKVIAINLTGVYLCCRRAIEIFLKQGGGTIVNTASMSSYIATPLCSPYTASKGGVMALTRSLAVDYAKFNIRVNAVCPGIIYTDLIKEVVKASKDPEALVASYNNMHPLGRTGTPEEVAMAVLYLASDDSSFCTGTGLMIDGGYTAR